MIWTIWYKIEWHSAELPAYTPGQMHHTSSSLGLSVHRICPTSNVPALAQLHATQLCAVLSYCAGFRGAFRVRTDLVDLATKVKLLAVKQTGHCFLLSVTEYEDACYC
jgi:hypothetical protein